MYSREEASTINLVFVVNWECSSTQTMPTDFGGLGLTVTAGHKVAVLELLRLVHLLLEHHRLQHCSKSTGESPGPRASLFLILI